MRVRTIFVRFQNRAIFEALILPLKDREGNLDVCNIDIIGEIYGPDGEKVPGWHVNFANQVPSEFQQYVISKPNTPSRIFSGDIK